MVPEKHCDEQNSSLSLVSVVVLVEALGAALWRAVTLAWRLLCFITHWYFFQKGDKNYLENK